MAAIGKGSDVALLRNPGTGKFDLQWDETGNPVMTDDETHRVLSLIVEHRAKWWADTTGTRGSRVHEVREIRKAAASLLKNYVLEGLQRAVDEKKIQPEPSVLTVRSSPTRVDLTVRYLTIGGKPASVTRSITA